MTGSLRGTLAPLALVLSAATGLPAPAAAATDAPVAEVGSSGAIAVHGSTLAWIDDGGARRRSFSAGPRGPGASTPVGPKASASASTRAAGSC